jgi:hypothetical protein
VTIAISIFFDHLYLEAALVTAYEVIKLGVPNLIHKIYLIYLDNNHSDDDEAHLVIQNFCSAFNSNMPIIAIKVQNSLSEFSSFHFNNSIIYKSLIPSMIDYEPFIMNIDAGIILGGKFERFLQELNIRICSDSNSWVIGAHCHSPSDLLPSILLDQPHNSLAHVGK